MVEPVSLGLAAAALLASKFGEGLAKDAGSSSWQAITHLRDLIARKFGHGPETHSPLTELEKFPTPQNLVAAAEAIETAARNDSEFAAELHQLITTARQEHRIDTIIATAYDNAKQVIIRGDNHGGVHF